MKYQQLRKKLLMESGILAGALIALAASALFLDGFSDDYKKSVEVMESKVQAITASSDALSGQYDNLRHNSELLKKILELQSRNELLFTSQAAKDRFGYLMDKDHLSNMHLSMSSAKEMHGDGYKRPTAVAVSSDVSIDFEGLSDEYVYNLLKAIGEEFPVSSKITSVTLTRQENITKDVLRTISQTGTAPLVGGEIKFVWLGIKPVGVNDNANAPTKP
jgi:hypothetical protein